MFSPLQVKDVATVIICLRETEKEDMFNQLGKTMKENGFLPPVLWL